MMKLWGGLELIFSPFINLSAKNDTARLEYKDEADIFYEDPVAFIQDYFQKPVVSSSDSDSTPPSAKHDNHRRTHNSQHTFYTNIQKMYENGGDTVRDPMDKRSVTGQDYFIDAFRIPSHVVLFDSLLQTYPGVEAYLKSQGWSEVS